ncbi:hypothetical protein BWL13_02279 [Microbacterium oleivorans]|uniref:hypothetical protein n=1 Tax=Microbacterium oleivorans TaxID=273677 RepID=UPI0009759BEB|nr:hypothetical protein [Microbacterium oleivorans]AZS44685.1 hypothetical protein BWL13_02279 [Microbacterium oleivorans]
MTGLPSIHESAGTPEDQPDLVARIRAVDGVTDVYSPRSAIARIPGLIAAAAGADGDRVAEVAVTVRDGMPLVAARIATASHDNTPAAARRVADALLANTPGDAQISIQIARIH